MIVADEREESRRRSSRAAGPTLTRTTGTRRVLVKLAEVERWRPRRRWSRRLTCPPLRAAASSSTPRRTRPTRRSACRSTPRPASPSRGGRRGVRYLVVRQCGRGRPVHVDGGGEGRQDLRLPDDVGHRDPRYFGSFVGANAPSAASTTNCAPSTRNAPIMRKGTWNWAGLFAARTARCTRSAITTRSFASPARGVLGSCPSTTSANNDLPHDRRKLRAAAGDGFGVAAALGGDGKIYVLPSVSNHYTQSNAGCGFIIIDTRLQSGEPPPLRGDRCGTRPLRHDPGRRCRQRSDRLVQAALQAVQDARLPRTCMQSRRSPPP